MTRLLRQICASLAVTIVVALQAHGAINAQHRIEHSLQFPGVAYADTSMTAHAHGDDHDHEHEADDHVDPVAIDTDDAAAFDVAGNGDDGAPMRHHHHGGGDVHLALVSPTHPLGQGLLSTANLGPASGTVPPGASGDGPTHPPRQLRA